MNLTTEKNSRQSEKIKVLIVEDHRIVREGIKSLLERSAGIEIIGEAKNGREALNIIRSGIIPQVLLTDLNMPEISGMELIPLVKESNPAIKVLILSMLDNENYVRDAIKAGANGYILKNSKKEELEFAIKFVYTDGKYICSDISLQLLERNNFFSHSTLRSSANVKLSKRELEILLLIAEGYTNAGIAEKLFTSKRTVEGHRKNLIEKTNAKNTAALIKYAIQNGLI